MGGAYNAGLGKINSQMDHGTKGQKWVQFFPSDPGREIGQSTSIGRSNSIISGPWNSKVRRRHRH